MKIQFLENFPLNCKKVHENNIGCILNSEKTENLLKYK